MNTIISKRCARRRAAVKLLSDRSARRLLPPSAEQLDGEHGPCSPDTLAVRATTITRVLREILDQTHYFKAGANE